MLCNVPCIVAAFSRDQLVEGIDFLLQTSDNFPSLLNAKARQIDGFGRLVPRKFSLIGRPFRDDLAQTSLQ